MESTVGGAPPSQGTRIARIEHQLAVAQQITHMGSWEWDPITNTVTWSDELYRIYGFEPRSHEVTLESFLAHVHPDDRPMVERKVGAALAQGSRFAWIERILRPDGTIRVLDTLGEVLRDETGRPTGLIGTCRDVTDEHARDVQIRRYADIVRNVQIGLSTWLVGDPEDVATVSLLAYNPAAERLARRSLAGQIGKSIVEIVPFAAGGQMESLIRQVARDGAIREASILGSRDPQNPTRAVSIKAFPLPEGCVGIAIEDITVATIARKLQEAEQSVLEMIAEGAPLTRSLSSLVLAIEAHSPPVIGAISLREGDGARYPERVAPSLHVPVAQLHVHALAPILASDQRDLGELVLYVAEPRPPSEEGAKVVERVAHLARIAIERCQLEDQLRELSAHVESVREDERTGIAREIHDELGQALTALKMDTMWILRRASSESLTLTTKGLIDKLTGMSEMIDEVIQQVRRISAELRPGVLDDLGLVAAIEWQAQEFEARSGTTCVVRSNVSDAVLDRRVSTAAFRIFQEALTNVTRHADAKLVEVRLAIDRESLELEVTDDGKGISPDAARSPKSLGLLGVRERARRLGGNVTIGRASPQGTRVTLTVPLGGGGGR